MKTNEILDISTKNPNTDVVSTSMPLDEIVKTPASPEKIAADIESDPVTPDVRVLFMPPLFRAKRCLAKVERHAWDEEDEISIVYLGWPVCPHVAAMFASREQVSSFDDFDDEDSIIGTFVDTAEIPDDARSVESCVTTHEVEWDDEHEYWALFSDTAQTTYYDERDQEYALCNHGQFCSSTEENPITDSNSTSSVFCYY